MKNKNEYLEAAKLLATCTNANRPYVLELLQRSGIDLSEVKAIIEAERIESSAEKRAKERKEYTKMRWRKTNDELSLYLRTAFDDGLNFTRISEVSGVARPTIYRVMWGERHGREETRAAIRKAVDLVREESKVLV